MSGEPINAPPGRTDLTPAGSALQFSGLQQVIVIALTGLLLDGGVIGTVCFYAFVAYWFGVLLIWLRRRTKGFTKVDLFLLRWGFLILCLISYNIARVVWRQHGFVS